MPVSPSLPEYVRPRGCLHTLTPARRAVVEMIKRNGGQTVEQLAEYLGVSPSAIRQHLQYLIGEGLVDFRESLPHGRGRPKRLYELTEVGEELFPRHSGSIALRLLAELAESNPDIVIPAVRGRLREDACRYVQEFAQKSGRAATVQDLAGVFEDMAYGASIEDCGPDRALLTFAHCPVLDLARVTPELCDVELENMHTMLDGCAIRRVRHRLRGDAECSFLVQSADAPGWPVSGQGRTSTAAG